MSTQQITQRIISDAEAEAAEAVKAAEEQAAKTLADASARAETIRKEAEEEVAQKRKSILDKRAAVARLDCSKLALKEKRKVIDTIYDEAHSRLLELSKENCLQLMETLLQQYAEDGDEIWLSKNFAYESEAQVFPVVAEKHLTFSAQKADIEGGFLLKGKYSDKDLSYKSLLAADREGNEAQLAAEIF